MKTPFLLFLLAVVAARAQGTIDFGNNDPAAFRAPIYGPEPSNPTVSLTGQSPVGTPSGTTVYGGPLLQGTRYVMALYAGPASVADPALLTFITSQTFRTATGNVLPAGLISTITDVPIPGVPTGVQAKFQIRAWDVLSGADYDSASIRGASALVLSAPLGPSPTGPVLVPDSIGWTSFNIFEIPEPSTFALAGLGAIALGTLRAAGAGAKKISFLLRSI